MKRPGTMPWPTLRAVLRAERGEVDTPPAHHARSYDGVLGTVLFLVAALAIVTVSIAVGLVASA
jgi:hypothetical protein